MKSNKIKYDSKNSLNRLFHLLGLIGLVYGLWVHDWIFIVAGVVLVGIGHLSLCYKVKKKKPKKK
ncbi:hypothetical protein KAI04_02840 [Candidatus Pacearchaeota archaeon]|nr:hypothetical protein [Candidatus Pacearchaeota archaeon]